MNRILRYFLQGLIITVPVVITAFVIYKIIRLVGSFVELFGTIVSPVVDPFIVLSITIGLILFMGMLGSSIILKPIFNVFDHALEHTPFIKTIYSSIKDLLSAFVGSKKRFDKPVLITINKENNVQQLGFVTKEDLNELGITEKKVAVYMPMSYSFAGNLIIVPSSQIQAIDASSAEVMKFIISGGVTDIED
jgi:uncharacterized membrane protein